MKKNIIKKGNIILPFIATLYVLWPLKDLGLSSILYEAVASIFIVFYLFSMRGKIKINNININYIIVAIVLTVMFFLPNASSDIAKTRPIIINFLLCSFLITANITDKSKYSSFKKIFIVFTTFYAVLNLICVIFPSFYLNTLLPLLRGTDKVKATRFIKGGYGIMIDNTASYLPNILCMGISIIISYYISKSFIKKKYLLILFIFIMSFFFYGRRSELISVIAAVVMTFVIYTDFLRKENIPRILAGLLAFSVIIVIFIYLLNSGYFPRIEKTINMLLSFSDKNVEFDDLNELSTNRLYLWRIAFNNFLSNPLFGIGWGKFTYQNGLNVHNTYIQFLCEGGIIGFALLIVPIFNIYFKTYKVLKRAKASNNSQAKECILISYILQTYFVVLNFIDPSFYKTYFTFLFAICVILLEYSIELLNRNTKNE